MNSKKDEILHTVFIALGSNLGNRILNLQHALDLISSKIGSVNQVGKLYETEPWGFFSDDWFINTVVKVRTNLEPFEILNRCKWIERSLGRERKNNQKSYISRTVDLDILFYDHEIVNLPELSIPHPHIANRKFVLVPLQDIDPNFVHPVLKESVNKLLKSCPDKTELNIMEENLAFKRK